MDGFFIARVFVVHPKVKWAMAVPPSHSLISSIISRTAQRQ